MSSKRRCVSEIGISQSKVSRIEQGRNVPTEDDVVALADIYLAGERANPAVRRRLVELARDIRAEHRPVVMARSKGRPDVFQARLARIEAGGQRDGDELELRDRCLELFKVVSKNGTPEVWLLGQRLTVPALP